MILFARRLVLTVSIATGVVWLGAGIASADARSELEAAQRDYALARDAEKLASEALDRAEDTLKAAVAHAMAQHGCASSHPTQAAALARP